MKAVILAAGYATRLYPLTLDRPKPLLEVGGRPILDHLLDRLAPIGLERIYVVTNAKFAQRFREWASAHETVEVIDDATTSDDDKLGAIGDLGLVLEREHLAADLLVAAGDSLFSENLDGFARYGQERDAPVIGVYDVGDLELIKRYSAIETDDDGRITLMEEKPADPQTTLTGIALYYYPQHVLPLIRRYLAEGNNPDQPGRLVQWLYPQLPFYTWRLEGRWYDIGSHETLAAADAEFTKLAQG
jgi:glucose-1-phosphate thymidylyltransferase